MKVRYNLLKKYSPLEDIFGIWRIHHISLDEKEVSTEIKHPKNYRRVKIIVHKVYNCKPHQPSWWAVIQYSGDMYNRSSQRRHERVQDVPDYLKGYVKKGIKLLNDSK